MNNKVQVIKDTELFGKRFQVFGTSEQPLFLAKDVAYWLGYDTAKSARLVDFLDDEDKVRLSMSTLGGVQETWFVTEEGLYEILMQSRKPIAKEFKKQVKEILKSVRKNGMYATDNLLDDPDLLLKTVTRLTEERRARLQAEQEAAVLKEVVEIQAPKVEYHDKYMVADGSYTTTELANKVGQVIKEKVSAQKLNQYLMAAGILNKKIKTRDITQKFADRGWHCYREGVAVQGSMSFKQLRWTTRAMKEIPEYIMSQYSKLKR